MAKECTIFGAKEITKLHQETLYPVVRIRTTGTVGSGSIVYSKLVPETKKEYETYILTNHHVIEDAIQQVDRWSSLLQRKIKGDVFADVDVEIFEYQYESWEPSHMTINAEIITYDQDQDLGLLKLKTIKKMPYVARMLPRGDSESRLKMFQRVITVGCGLGEEPFPSIPALLGNLNTRISNPDGKGYTFHLVTSPAIYGNSGGACFSLGTNELMGIPSRVAVTGVFGKDVITHMAYIIPIERVYNFFEDELLYFLYDENYTSEECFDLRNKKREKDEKRMAIAMSRSGEIDEVSEEEED